MRERERERESEEGLLCGILSTTRVFPTCYYLKYVHCFLASCVMYVCACVCVCVCV